MASSFSNIKKRKVEISADKTSREEWLSVKLREAEAYGLRWLEKARTEELRRFAAEDQLSLSRHENIVLRAENQQLQARLAELSNLPALLAAAVEDNKKLSRELNRRSGREEPYGLSTPSSKRVNKKNSSEENQKKRGGAVPGHKGSGRCDFTMAEADRVVKVDAVPGSCSCGGDGLWKRHSAYPHCVINYIPSRTEKVYYEKTLWQCSRCERIGETLTPGVMPGALYSNKAAANFLTEHYLHGHTVGSLEKRWNINHGTFHNFARRASLLLQPLFDQIVLDLRSCPLVYADETPWSKDGARGYSWFFGNDRCKIFIFRHTRSSAVPIDMLGTEPLELTLITDRYGGYTVVLKVGRQYCYIHLLRDVKKEEENFPEEEEVIRFAAKLKPLLTNAVTLRSEKLSRKDYCKKAEQLKTQIMEVCNQQARHPAVQHIQNIFRENQHRLFQWIKSPDIPADNNYSERELRPIVIARRISFGSQSEQGLKNRETLMTILHTAKCRGYDPAEFLENVLNVLAENKNADISKFLSAPADRTAAAGDVA